MRDRWFCQHDSMDRHAAGCSACLRARNYGTACERHSELTHQQWRDAGGPGCSACLHEALRKADRDLAASRADADALRERVGELEAALKAYSKTLDTLFEGTGNWRMTYYADGPLPAIDLSDPINPEPMTPDQVLAHARAAQQPAGGKES